MNGSQTIPIQREHQFRKHFFGASPVLRVLAWFAVICLLGGWVLLALLIGGIDRTWFASTILTSHLVAFVAGISSCCPFGGIAALLAAVTLFVCLFFAAHGMAIR